MMLTLLLAVSYYAAPCTALETPESTSTFEVSSSEAIYQSNSLSNPHHTPCGIPCQEQSLEELVEDLNESHKDAALPKVWGFCNVLHPATLGKRISENARCLGTLHTPLYILFHAWKNHLV